MLEKLHPGSPLPTWHGTSWHHWHQDADFLHCLVVSYAKHSGLLYIYIWLYDGMKSIDIYNNWLVVEPPTLYMVSML